MIRLTILSRHMFRCIGLYVAIVSMPALAEVPPMSDAQLMSQAALIASGYVVSVSERDAREVRDGGLLVTAHYVVTMAVEQVQKGKLLPGQHEIRFTGYRNTETPPHWVGGSNTLRLELQAGDLIKVYLAHDGNDWVLFHHNGIWMSR
jgi:hypothetical protein